MMRKKSKAALYTMISNYTTQGSNPGLLCLLYWRRGSLPLASPGKHRHADQWNRGDANPHIYGQLMYNKGTTTSGINIRHLLLLTSLLELFYCISYILGFCVSILICFKIFLDIPFDFFFDTLFKSVYQIFTYV